MLKRNEDEENKSRGTEKRKRVEFLLSRIFRNDRQGILAKEGTARGLTVSLPSSWNLARGPSNRGERATSIVEA